MADGSSHARHDRFAIADAAAWAVPAGAAPAGAAPAVIGTCPACGRLFIDLLTIRTAIREARTPGRTRDFLLTAADAARLRPSRWRRLLAAIGTQRDAITRPIAVSCTALGLAGLLLTTVPFGAVGALGGAASAASEAPPEIHVTGEPMPPVAKDLRVLYPAARSPLTGLSIGLLSIGGVVFAVRRIAPRLSRVR